MITRRELQKVKKCSYALNCPILTVKQKCEIIGVKIKEMRTKHGIINIIEHPGLKN